jgi:hypothetical protein
MNSLSAFRHPCMFIVQIPLHDQSRVACTCPCFMSMSILHVHVHVACPCQCCMPMSMSMFINIEMPECRTVWHPVSQVPDWKKLTIPEQVRYRTKLTQSGIFVVRYRTKIRDAGTLMPALVFSMPMPSPAYMVAGQLEMSERYTTHPDAYVMPRYSISSPTGILVHGRKIW